MNLEWTDDEAYCNTHHIRHILRERERAERAGILHGHVPVCTRPLVVV